MKRNIYIILALSILFTVVIQLDLTRAILFDDYFGNTKVSGVNYYLSLINESSKGNLRLGSPYILERRYDPYLYPALNINAAGLFKRIFSLDIKTYAAIMGYLAVFAVMAFLLTAFSQIFNFNYFGYLAATAYIFFPGVITYMWNRTLSPEINFIPLALFLIFYFSNFRFWTREVGMAVLTGLLFYVYPYYWTFVLALLAVSDLHEFWIRGKIIWKLFYKYLIIAGVASWYAIHLWQIHQISYYQESMVRIGSLHSRLPAGWYTQAVLLASLVLFLFFKKYVFPKINLGILAGGALDKVAAGLITGLIVLNQQLVTGMQLEFNSHYTSIILFFLVAFWGSLVFLLINNLSSYYRNIFIFVSFLLAVGSVASQAYLTLYNFDSGAYIGGRADEVTGWFLKNKIQDRVVYAPEDIGDEINLWTGNYLVWNDNQALQLAPTSELIGRFTYFDITNQNITDHLFERQTAFLGQTFIAKMQKDNVINKIKAKLLGRNFVPATLAEYTKYDFSPMYAKRTNPKLIEFNGYLEKYHVDYLVYRQKDRKGIYGDVPGEIVFDGEEYLVKKRL